MREAIGWTYGLELELADVDNHTPLPDGWKWSKQEHNVVNWDGTAIDPLRQMVTKGGEINSPVYSSIYDLITDVAEVWYRLKPNPNYRAGMHVHIAIPDITIEDVKKIAQYTRDHLPLQRVCPMELDAADLEGLEGEDLANAKRRYKWITTVDRHYLIPEERHARRMKATTIPEFINETALKDKKGKGMWWLTTREAVNLGSLKKHGTIEFRCFNAPHEEHEVEIAVTFAKEWLLACLNDLAHPEGLVKLYEDLLPRKWQYIPRLEKGWLETNFQHHTRAEVAAALEKMGWMG